MRNCGSLNRDSAVSNHFQWRSALFDLPHKPVYLIQKIYGIHFSALCVFDLFNLSNMRSFLTLALLAGSLALRTDPFSNKPSCAEASVVEYRVSTLPNTTSNAAQFVQSDIPLITTKWTERTLISLTANATTTVSSGSEAGSAGGDCEGQVCVGDVTHWDGGESLKRAKI